MWPCRCYRACLRAILRNQPKSEISAISRKFWLQSLLEIKFLRPFLLHYWKLYLWHMPIVLLVFSHIVLCWNQTKSNMCWGEVHKDKKVITVLEKCHPCAQDLKVCFAGQRLPFWCFPTWKFWLRSLGTIWSKKYLKIRKQFQWNMNYEMSNNVC